MTNLVAFETVRLEMESKAPVSHIKTAKIKVFPFIALAFYYSSRRLVLGSMFINRQGSKIPLLTEPSQVYSAVSKQNVGIIGASSGSFHFPKPHLPS